ncbi:MAG: hypothetical protein WBL23_15275 [Salinisphaera sp.]|uniref:hypothetical protein n=1 Tax=Salinisphaera sp. TaxID=1914330 RepID=UPI003C7DB7A2
MRELRRLFWILSCCLVAGPALAAPAFDEALETGQGPVLPHIVEHASFVLRWNGQTIYVDPVGASIAMPGSVSPM